MVLVPTLLSVDSLPQHTAYPGAAYTIHMYTFLERFRRVVETLAHNKIIDDCSSLGVAMAAPKICTSAGRMFYGEWDDPSHLVWFVGGWGRGQTDEQCMANAVRQLRPLARTGRSSTLEMVRKSPDEFRDFVPSEDANHNYPWGDFAYGGGVEVRFNNLGLLGAVNGLTPLQNELVAHMFLECLTVEIQRADSTKI